MNNVVQGTIQFPPSHTASDNVDVREELASVVSESSSHDLNLYKVLQVGVFNY